MAHGSDLAPANAMQRQRSTALVVAMCALAALGALARREVAGVVPAPCPQPALRGDILVCDGNGSPVGARAWLVGAKLDVNAASTRELEQIPGVGPALAARIAAAREARGGRFTDITELDDVSGIGPKTLSALSAVLEVR